MRYAAASAGLALALLSAPAATAQNGTSVELSGVSDNAVVQATVPLKANATSSMGVRKLTMWIDGEVVAEVTPQSLRQKAEANYEWDTTRAITSDQLAPNRSYEVKVRAVSHSGAEDETTARVVVENAPSTPGGLEISTSNRTVNMTWNANPEPDIIGYRVERYYGNDYVSAAVVERPAFSEIQDPGEYSYRVVALRHTDTTADGVASAPTAPVTATIAAQPPPGGTRAGTVRVRAGGGSKRGGVVTRRIGVGGLPSGAALPQRPGLSGLPDAPAALPWGSYEKRLPYKLPKGGIPVAVAPANGGRATWSSVVPPDGLRWVALGLLIMVLAALSRFWAWRIQVAPKPAKIEA